MPPPLLGFLTVHIRLGGDGAAAAPEEAAGDAAGADDADGGGDACGFGASWPSGAGAALLTEAAAAVSRRLRALRAAAAAAAGLAAVLAACGVGPPSPFAARQPYPMAAPGGAAAGADAAAAAAAAPRAAATSCADAARRAELDAAEPAALLRLRSWDVSGDSLDRSDAKGLVASMFHSLNLLSPLRVSPIRLDEFVGRVEAAMGSQPFYGWCHLFDVTHAAWMFLDADGVVPSACRVDAADATPTPTMVTHH